MTSLRYYISTTKELMQFALLLTGVDFCPNYGFTTTNSFNSSSIITYHYF